MLVLKILLWIIAIIFAILLLCFFAPLDLEFTATPKKNDFALRLYRINLARKRKKKQKTPEPKKEKSKKKETLSQKFQHKKADLEEILEWVRLILRRLGWLLSNIRVRNFSIKYTSGGEDAAKAALEYGAACALIYPIAALVENKMHIALNGMKLDVSCDYDRGEPDYLFEVFLRLRGYHAIVALILIIKEKYAKK